MPRLAVAPKKAPRLRLRSRNEAELDQQVTGVCFTRDSVAAALGDGTVRLALIGSSSLKSASLHKGAILCACSTADGSALLTGGDDGKVCRTTVHERGTLIADDRWIEAVAAHRSGAIACAAGKKAIIRYDDGKIMDWQSERSVCALAATADGFAFATVNSVALFDLAKNSVQEPLLKFHGLPVAAIASPDGRFVVVATYDGSLHACDVNGGTGTRMGGYTGKPRSLSWSADGAWLASSGAPCIVMWPFAAKDGPRGNKAQILAARDSLVTAVACHPRAQVVSAGYDDGAIVFASYLTSRVATVRAADGDPITSVGFCPPEGDWFAYGTEHGTFGTMDIGAIE